MVEFFVVNFMKRYEDALRSTLSYPNESSKECIQFLNKHVLENYLDEVIDNENSDEDATSDDDDDDEEEEEEEEED
jgi:hypothetical protein